LKKKVGLALISVKEKKMGIRGSDTHSLMFSDVKVPKENRIGEDGGFNFAMGVLNGGRIIVSSGIRDSNWSYELALKYSQEQKLLKRNKHQVI
jgi:alkylation response protein AidB-like acyl-CoA dehydrogenase